MPHELFLWRSDGGEKGSEGTDEKKRILDHVIFPDRARLLYMSDPRHLDLEILSHYLSGEVTPHEMDLVTQWVTDNPGARRWLDETQARWVVLPHEDVPPLDLVAFQARLTNRVRKNTEPHIKLRRPVWHPRWKTIAHIGAVTSLIIVAWFGAIERMTSTLSGSTSIYTTANGERATVTLPDGSIVTLNVGSRLEVPSNYAAGTRTVRLHGEAQFTVTHDYATPFTVLAGPSTTRVLGTTFVVRHYGTDTAALIAVRDGKVAVGDTILSENQQVLVGPHGIGVVRESSISPFGFARGVLILENTPLQDALATLNRWYDADIRIGDPVLDRRRLTGEFTAGSLSELIEILEWTYHIRVVRSGRILTLFPRG